MAMESFAKPRKPNTGMSITSLMDVLTIMLIFLLVNYSDSEDTAPKAPEFVRLPQLDANPTGYEGGKYIQVNVGKNKVSIADKTFAFGSVDELQSIQDQITEFLVPYREKLDDKTNARFLAIQSDRDVNYKVLDHVLMAASAAGMNKFHFVALGKKQ
jgi:biopolymer transport protein ExbD